MIAKEKGVGLHSVVKRLFDLAFRIGALSFEEAYKTLIENVDVFEEGIEYAIIEKLHPAEIISLLDLTKSLVYRNQLLRRQMEIGGYGEPGLMLFLPSDGWWDAVLKRNLRMTVCYLYLSKRGSLWAFTESVGGESPLTYGSLEIIPEAQIANFSSALISYIHSTVTTGARFDLLEELLEQLGKGLIPHLQTMPGRKNLVICPHGILNIIPWHAVSLTNGDTAIFLDDLFSAITYISSVQDLGSIPLSQGATTTAIPRMLAVLDSKAQLKGIERETTFFKILQDGGVPLDIVADSDLRVAMLAKYPLLTWSSHAKSDPCSWGGSAIQFGTTRYTALEIARHWTLPLGSIVVLSACETAIELSALPRLDEYCGLDHSFRIAGAQSVCGTMWPVRDAVAEKWNFMFWTALLGLEVTPARAVVLVQRMFRQQVLPILTREEEDKPNWIWHAFLNAFSDKRLLLPSDFRRAECWAVFRCFGK